MSFSKNNSKQKVFSILMKAGVVSTGLAGLFVLSLTISSCKPRMTETSKAAATPPAESLPDDPDRFMKIKLKEEALHDLSNGGLGIFSAHPDANQAPPTINSPEPFFKARPEAPDKEKLKQ